MAEEKPPPEFVNALGTEYFMLQSTATSTISESGSRVSINGAQPGRRLTGSAYHRFQRTSRAGSCFRGRYTEAGMRGGSGLV
jgi:hypothetical protein